MTTNKSECCAACAERCGGEHNPYRSCCNVTPKHNNTDLRGKIEQVLWKHYDPQMSPNMEEAAGEILALIAQDKINTMPIKKHEEALMREFELLFKMRREKAKDAPIWGSKVEVGEHLVWLRAALASQRTILREALEGLKVRGNEYQGKPLYNEGFNAGIEAAITVLDNTQEK